MADNASAAITFNTLSATVFLNTTARATLTIPGLRLSCSLGFINNRLAHATLSLPPLTLSGGAGQNGISGTISWWPGAFASGTFTTSTLVAQTLGPQLASAYANGIRAANMANQMGLPLVVPASTTVSSYLVPTMGWQRVDVGILSTQSGNLIINKYADSGGQFLVASVTTAMSASVALNVDTGGSTMSAFNITASNSSGTTATISKLAVILSPV